jgi:hypothetical protein
MTVLADGGGGGGGGADTKGIKEVVSFSCSCSILKPLKKNIGSTLPY